VHARESLRSFVYTMIDSSISDVRKPVNVDCCSIHAKNESCIRSEYSTASYWCTTRMLGKYSIHRFLGLRTRPVDSCRSHMDPGRTPLPSSPPSTTHSSPHTGRASPVPPSVCTVSGQSSPVLYSKVKQVAKTRHHHHHHHSTIQYLHTDLQPAINQAGARARARASQAKPKVVRGHCKTPPSWQWQNW
jgi:hypothetical protein